MVSRSKRECQILISHSSFPKLRQARPHSHLFTYYTNSMVFIINMRIFKTIFVIVMLFTSLTNAAPASFLRLEHRTIDEDSSPSLDDVDITVTSTTSPPEPDTYDQRQNGTENYRIQVKGLVVLLAPVETLLLAGGGLGGANEMLGGLGGLAGSPIEKPKPKPDDVKPFDENSNENLKARMPERKSEHRPHLKIISLLAPFLKRNALHATSFRAVP